MASLGILCLLPVSCATVSAQQGIAGYRQVSSVALEGPGDRTGRAVLYMDRSSGRTGIVRVEEDGQVESLWDSGELDRPALHRGERAGEFVVSEPSHRLDLPPPWLRIRKTHRWVSTGIASLESAPGTPASTAQVLELANYLHLSGEPAAAMEQLEPVLRGNDEALRPLALWLAVRACRDLGRDGRARELAAQLRSRYPDSPEAGALPAR